MGGRRSTRSPAAEICTVCLRVDRKCISMRRSEKFRRASRRKQLKSKFAPSSRLMRASKFKLNAAVTLAASSCASTIDGGRGRMGKMTALYAPLAIPLKIQLHRKASVSGPLQRRAENRIRTKMFVKLSDPATGVFEITSTIDVSSHGAGVVTRNRWDQEHELLVQPIRGSLASRARVARCEAREDGSFLLGLELYPTTEDWTRTGKLARKN